MGGSEGVKKLFELESYILEVDLEEVEWKKIYVNGIVIWGEEDKWVD